VKIVFFTKGDRMLPSSRTRAYLVADYLRMQGVDAVTHQIRTRPWWNLSAGRLRDLRRNAVLLMSVKKGDVLYLHKATDQLDFMGLVLLRKWILRRGYIFDFDDAIFLPTWNRAAKARLMVRHADAVVVGSHFLQEYALRYNKRSYVLSAPIDTQTTYLPAAHRTDDPRVRIGWTGTPSHFENMKLLLAPLQRLVGEGHGIVFVQLGGGDKIHTLMSSVKGLALEYVPELPWNEPKKVVERLQDFDIGVMPLQKTEFNSGKDGWKAKEYMGCGVATVLSDWGENPYIVTNDVDGLLVDTEEDWYRALKRLITDASYRSKIGAAGRARMQREYSNEVIFSELLRIIGLAGGR
jgi:glycosyltransferase involved in cell wall biosynthesis